LTGKGVQMKMNFDMIAPKELDRYVENRSAFIIDLRTPDEYVSKHIRGAVNIPYEKLENCHLMPRNLVLILYCERGSVSLVAAKELAAKGYRVKSVTGGIRSYRGKYLESFN